MLQRLLLSLWIIAFGLAGCGVGSEPASELNQEQFDAWRNRVFVSYFHATPSSVAAFEPVELRWSAPNAVRVDIEGVAGGLPNQGAYTVYPDQDRVYVLNAYGADGGFTQRRIQVIVGRDLERAEVEYFWASALSLTKGQSTTLNWKVNACSRLEIDLGNGIQTAGCNAPGSMSVTPVSTTRYEVRAYDRQNRLTATSSLVVNVAEPVQKPRVDVFYAGQTTIQQGEATELYFATRNTQRVEIFGVPGAFGPSGSVSVRPQQTTTYVLYAFGTNGEVEASSLTVTVNQVLIVEQFYAVNPNLTLGQTTQLVWNARNCNRVEITGAPASALPCSGSLDIRPQQTTTYTLSAFASNGQVVNQLVTVQVVQPKPAPTVDYFYASNLDVEAGQTSVLYWKVNNAQRVEIQGVPQASLAKEGQWQVRPDQTTIYRLIVYGENGQIISNDLRINVLPIPNPVIEYFYASTSQIKGGESVSFYWQVGNAARVELIPDDQNPISVAAVSSLTLQPQSGNRYTLVVYGRNGQVLRQSVNVYVDRPMTPEEQALLEKLLKEMGAVSP